MDQPGVMLLNKVNELTGIFYDDLPPVPLLTARVAANAPTLAVFSGGVQQYTFDAVNDEVHGATEVVHKYSGNVSTQSRTAKVQYHTIVFLAIVSSSTMRYSSRQTLRIGHT